MMLRLDVKALGYGVMLLGQVCSAASTPDTRSALRNFEKRYIDINAAPSVQLPARAVVMV
jgi:hypothetical protein